MDSLEELFCHIDDFCQQFEPKWHSLLLGEGVQHRQRQRSLSLSEIMTILVSFHQQQYQNFKALPGNTDDRKPVEDLLQGLYGKVFADRGYVSKALAERLFETCGIEFFAKPKRNMKNHLMRLTNKLLACKRAMVETVIDQLKNIS
jgi:hypothetical protein